jgi:hypothetical protein
MVGGTPAVRTDGHISLAATQQSERISFRCSAATRQSEPTVIFRWRQPVSPNGFRSDVQRQPGSPNRRSYFVGGNPAVRTDFVQMFGGNPAVRTDGHISLAAARQSEPTPIFFGICPSCRILQQTKILIHINYIKK